MLKYKRYLLTQIITSTLSVSIVLIIAVMLTLSLRFMDLIVNNNASLFLIIKLIAFLLPDLLTSLFPIATAVASIFIFNKLTGDRELLVLRTSGLSDWQIAKPFLILASILTLLLLSSNLFWLPVSFKKFRNLEIQLREDIAGYLLQDGQFSSQNGVTVYVQSKKAHNQLEGLFIYDGRDAKKPVTITAQKGLLIDTQDQFKLLMVNGTRQEYSDIDNTHSILSFDEYIYDLKIFSGVQKIYTPKPNEFFVHQLAFPQKYNIPQNLHQRYRAEAHQRLLVPFMVLSFSFLVSCVLLSLKHSRKSRIKQVALLAFVLCALQIGCFTFFNLAASNTLWLACAYFLILGPIFYGFYHLRIRKIWL